MYFKNRQPLSNLQLMNFNEKEVQVNINDNCDCVEWQRLEALLPPEVEDRGNVSYEVHHSAVVGHLT